MEFKPGNIVKMIDTYWHGNLNESREDIGKLFVIEYSYGEKYGDGRCYGGYSISVWKMDLVLRGGMIVS